MPLVFMAFVAAAIVVPLGPKLHEVVTRREAHVEVIVVTALLFGMVALLFLVPAWVARLIERTPGRRRRIVVPALLGVLATTGMAGIYALNNLLDRCWPGGPNVADCLEQQTRPNYARGWIALGFVVAAILALGVAVAVTRRQAPEL